MCCVCGAVPFAALRVFTGVHARCVAWCVRRPWPLAACFPVCAPGVLCWVCGILGHLLLVQPRARLVCCIACVGSWAAWRVFTGVSAWCVALCVWCPGLIGTSIPVCSLAVLCCVCGLRVHSALVNWFACMVCCVVCVVHLVAWRLRTSVHALCVALCVWCPEPLGACSAV